MSKRVVMFGMSDAIGKVCECSENGVRGERASLPEILNSTQGRARWALLFIKCLNAHTRRVQ